MTLIIDVANLMAHYLGLGSYLEEAEIDILEEPSLHALDLPPDQFDKLIKSSTEKTRELIASFKLA